MERTTAHETRIRIQIQYIETPRLRLSQAQLARLFGVSEALCREALATADGTFTRSGAHNVTQNSPGCHADATCGAYRDDHASD